MVMDERCKHDLLRGQCGFCLFVLPGPAEHGNGHDPTEWVERFANLQRRPFRSGDPTTNHFRIVRTPSPGASAGSTAIPAIPVSGNEPSRPPPQGLELLAPGWGFSASEGVGLGGLGEARPALLHGRARRRRAEPGVR